ncbi:major facilitator superfamily domain-containing protein 6-like [Notothenia coriiceps]|uniref:Major facilitator superfamily domain-containing protein 6-like n=1 Tax=Notothenia coriiceps TaxID=8208 RepID=A0A6I9P2G5_9TELE|nr:PREDICTED: major facilitator superfamily domain-containing protein 6-like [Notothenia coriiceps]
MKRNKQINIQRTLALAGAFHFLSSCSRASLLPFLTLFLRQQGLSPSMTGIIMGTKHLIALLWSPASSLLSKHYNQRRAVIVGSLVCSASVALLPLFFPPVEVHENCHFTSDLSGGPTQSPTGGGGGIKSSAAPHTLPRTTDSQTPAKTLADAQPAPVLTNETALLDKPPLPKDNANKSQTSGGGVIKTSVALSSVSETKANNATVPQSASVPAKRLADVKPAPVLTNETALHHLDKPPLSDDITNKSQTRGGGAIKSGVALSSESRTRNKRSEVKMQEEEEENHQRRFEFLGSLKVMDAQHQLFFLILITVSLWELMASPLEWTADDGLYEYLDFADASDRYRITSIWKILGAAFAVGGTGLLVSRLPCLIAGDFPRMAAHFFLYAVIGFVALPVAAYLPLHLNKKRDRGFGLLKALQLVHNSPHALLCVATTFLVACAGSVVDNFLLWQMQDHGSSEMHMGVSLALALVSQAAYPLLKGRISKLLTPGKVLVVGAASLGVQCFYFSFLWGPWAVIPAQMLSCLSSGALWWAVKIQCEEVATPGSERSVRRIFSSLSLNLGSSLGSFSGGFVVQRFGLTWLFRGTAMCVMLWCVCLPLLQFKAPQQCRINYSRLLAANGSDASDSESESDWLEKAMEENRSKNNSGRKIH